MLNASRLPGLSDGHLVSDNYGHINVILPSGSMMHVRKTNADDVSEILRKVRNLSNLK